MSHSGGERGVESVSLLALADAPLGLSLVVVALLRLALGLPRLVALAPRIQRHAGLDALLRGYSQQVVVQPRRRDDVLDVVEFDVGEQCVTFALADRAVVAPGMPHHDTVRAALRVRRALEAEQLLDVLDRVGRRARAQALAHHGVEINEAVPAGHAVGGLRRDDVHRAEAAQRALLVVRVVVEVRAWMVRPVRAPPRDEGLERLTLPRPVIGPERTKRVCRVALHRRETFAGVVPKRVDAHQHAVQVLQPAGLKRIALEVEPRIARVGSGQAREAAQLAIRDGKRFDGRSRIAVCPSSGFRLLLHKRLVRQPLQRLRAGRYAALRHPPACPASHPVVRDEGGQCGLRLHVGLRQLTTLRARDASGAAQMVLALPQPLAAPRMVADRAVRAWIGIEIVARHLPDEVAHPAHHASGVVPELVHPERGRAAPLDRDGRRGVAPRIGNAEVGVRERRARRPVDTDPEHEAHMRARTVAARAPPLMARQHVVI